MFLCSWIECTAEKVSQKVAMVTPWHGIQCSLTGGIQLTLTHRNFKTALSAHAISAMVNIETCKILVTFTDQNDGIIILFTITDTL